MPCLWDINEDLFHSVTLGCCTGSGQRRKAAILQVHEVQTRQ